ncbi:hypothetical protein HK101_002042, partial [Irineochytrium annulatum]
MVRVVPDRPAGSNIGTVSKGNLTTDLQRPNTSRLAPGNRSPRDTVDLLTPRRPRASLQGISLSRCPDRTMGKPTSVDADEGPTQRKATRGPFAAYTSGEAIITRRGTGKQPSASGSSGSTDDANLRVRIVIGDTSQMSDLDATGRELRGRIGSAGGGLGSGLVGIPEPRSIVDLMDNRIRREVLGSFHRIFMETTATAAAADAAAHVGSQGSMGAKRGRKPPGRRPSPQDQVQPEYIDAAYATGRWSVGRFRRMVKELREPAAAHRPEGTFIEDIESLEWSMKAEAAAGQESGGGTGKDGDDGAGADEEADGEVWERYAKAVKGMTGSISDLSAAGSLMKVDVEGDGDVMGRLRMEAVDHFRDQVVRDFSQMEGDDFIRALYTLPRFRVGSFLLELVFGQVQAKVRPLSRLKREVLPSLAVLVVIQPNAPMSPIMLETLISLCAPLDLLTEDMVCSALEYCAHTQKSDSARVLLDLAGDKITSEGIVTALLPVCMRGADHYLAMLELFVMDKATQAELEMEGFFLGGGDEQEKKDGGGGVGAEKAEASNSQLTLTASVRNEDGEPGDENAKAFIVFVAKSSYLLFFLAAVGGYAKSGTVEELIEFYNNPCAAFLSDTIDEHQHRLFINHTFSCVCRLNYSTVAWAMIEKGLMPSAITSDLEDAIVLGHQNIVHLLLESLLITDDKLQPSGLPIAFRKSEPLTLLPMVARRFPREAAWFLEQLSCVPLPACVPRSKKTEPEVRSRPVKGVRLGTLSLGDTIRHRKENGGPMVHVWHRLEMNGQLRKAGSGKDDFEMESVICIAPDALIASTAIHKSLFGTSYNNTSPFIRLLAEEDEQIILQPIMRALMEFHWARGKFWLRFALQFFTTLIYIMCLAVVFVFVVQRQNAAPLQQELYIPPVELWPLSCMVLLFGSFFLFQEARECYDYPERYLRSGSNMVDLGIHVTGIYITITGALLNFYVQPLLMSLTLVLCAFRMIIHLRILPSVGPLIRLLVTASMNILPILIPMGVMAITFAEAFYLLEFEAAFLANTTSVHFNSWHVAIQSVLTMATADYSVLDYSGTPQIFALRFIFHICFIIFLVNIIIALMTVNVADIHANTTAAWLLEIAGLMVELELFWPWPMSYSMQATPAHIGTSGTDIEKRHKRQKLTDENGSILTDSPAYANLLNERSAILYTWPQEYVMKTAWWTRLASRAVEEYGNVDKFPDRLRKGNAGSSGGAPEPEKDRKEKPGYAWNNLLDTLGIMPRKSAVMSSGDDSEGNEGQFALGDFPEPIQEVESDRVVANQAVVRMFKGRTSRAQMSVGDITMQTASVKTGLDVASILQPDPGP